MLNAFRHHRNSHTWDRFDDDSEDQCAQRLSASSEFSHPCRPRASRESDVLNAFRHHRNSHQHRSTCKNFSYVVLNAFRHHRNSHAGDLGDLIPGSCAQRLSASSEFSRERPQRMQVLLDVLNAFRHHRNSHTLTQGERVHSSACAQRLSASSEFSRSFHRQCSRYSRVLNAFRHHRNSHTGNRTKVQAAIECSTPFGIIGILTRGECRSETSLNRAQRLSASSEFSLGVAFSS